MWAGMWAPAGDLSIAPRAGMWVPTGDQQMLRASTPLSQHMDTQDQSGCIQTVVSVTLNTLHGWSKGSHPPAKLSSLQEAGAAHGRCTHKHNKKQAEMQQISHVKKTTLYTADSTPEQHRAKCNQESLELRATGDRFYLQHRGCPRLTTV